MTEHPTMDGQRAWAIQRAKCLRDAVASGDLLPIHAHTLAVQIANGIDRAEDDLNTFIKETACH